MAYAGRKNDYNTGAQLNLAHYNSLFPLIYFDLTYQTEKVTRDPKELMFRYSQCNSEFQCSCCCSLKTYNIPLKDEKGETVTEVFKTIFKEGRKPQYL